MNEQDYQKQIEWLEQVVNSLVGIVQAVKPKVSLEDQPLVQAVIDKANTRYSAQRD